MNDILLLKLRARTPVWIKSVLIKTPFGKTLAERMKKYRAEMEFQYEWATRFPNVKDKVAQYWDEYRYLPEIRQLVKLGEDAKLLDVGCGISSVLHFVEGEKYALDPNMVEYKQIYNYPKEFNLVHSGGESIPFEDSFFDTIFSSNMLDHVTDPVAVIDEIRRVLKPDGHFVFTVEIFPDRRKRNAAHPHTFTREFTHELLEGKFEIVMEKTSPWVSLNKFTKGDLTHKFEELILVLRNTK